jgi:hypothetical protein
MRGQYGRPCPRCNRILLPFKGTAWPPHYSHPAERVWCTAPASNHPATQEATN